MLFFFVVRIKKKNKTCIDKTKSLCFNSYM